MNPIVEMRLYEQMAMLSPVMAFSWSRWNHECNDRESVILCAVGHLDMAGPVDEVNSFQLNFFFNS
ncbi:unnamed protein product [Protopolystoma xenopodis]|uniref:Uncharacterized protein n=1 Tax=Protopolystoma xenopodis TaxID=117903 RepID=A0A3S5A3B4_9PLAT|nr:unnamed protein product [Protopolystoma xenopodis]